MKLAIDINNDRLAAFCQQWKITELALFGSVLRKDFGPDSDVDVLVTFAPDARWTLFDLMDMEEQLADLFGRPVDLLTRKGVEHCRNPLRRDGILSTAQVIHDYHAVNLDVLWETAHENLPELAGQIEELPKRDDV